MAKSRITLKLLSMPSLMARRLLNSDHGPWLIVSKLLHVSTTWEILLRGRKEGSTMQPSQCLLPLRQGLKMYQYQLSRECLQGDLAPGTGEHDAQGAEKKERACAHLSGTLLTSKLKNLQLFFFAFFSPPSIAHKHIEGVDARIS